MLRRTKKAVLSQLPDKIYQTIPVAPITKELKNYLLEEPNVELATARRLLGVAKVPSVLPVIKNTVNQTGKLLVFTYHKDVARMLNEALQCYRPLTITGDTSQKARQKAIDMFVSSPENQIFIGQIVSAGQGIDQLQKVCSHAIFAELSWVQQR